ncbi:MAG: ABC transporter ATP-binding protein [Burkholderiales bacterium]|nr:ABC transporter ATP-binding protein [Burkholderiales bacterium]
MSFLEVRDLALAFGGVRALDGVGFSVERGQVFAIIGPNGAGKTTVLNVVTRVFAPASGQVLLEGVDLVRMPRHAIAGAGVARTFQNIELFEGATVLDNLLLGRHRFDHGGLLSQMVQGRRARACEDASRERVEALIDFLDLAPHRNQRVAGLPYGVRKIVELGRALATEPRLLLLDEPASGLNPEETRDLAFWIDDIRHDLGVTVVMIEHDMSLVSEVADRVLAMNLGRALAEGTPAEVQSHPDVVAAYLGG